MSRSICPKCGNTDVSWIRDDADCAQYICLECKQDFYYPPKTLFDRITASPEVLAPEFVYCEEVFPGWDTWCSLLLGNVGYSTKREAIAATVEKLKEVCNE